MDECKHELKSLINPVSPTLYTEVAFGGLEGEILLLKYCVKCGAVFAVKGGDHNGEVH